ncbi:MAG: ATP-dependent sacrificial sulfur transferase LarE [Candidatus Hydrogenedentota bacterium]|jgi:uncharacterized protein
MNQLDTHNGVTPESLERKVNALCALLREYGRVAIAYSGGVDSAYLAAVAHDTLGDCAELVLADSPSIPRSEVKDAVSLATERGWRLTLIETREFENEAYLKNDGTRCFHCKDELFTQMDTFARERNIPVLAYGEIADDRLDPTRYGAKAAREHRVVAPLAEAGLYKQEIRALSAALGLPTADKPSFACLSSRFPVGVRVAPEDVARVEHAEEILRALSFKQFRARHHGDLVRIEVDREEIARLLSPELHEQVLQGMRAAGYRHVTVDLAGYRTGSTA